LQKQVRLGIKTSEFFLKNLEDIKSFLTFALPNRKRLGAFEKGLS
jgi:hypothetical protein